MGRQPIGKLDVRGDDEISSVRATKPGKPFSSKPELPFRLGPGRDLERYLLRERGNPNLASQERGRQRNRHFGVGGSAVPMESGVRLEHDLDEEVPGATPRRSSLALAGESQHAPVLDARWDGDFEAPYLVDSPASPAGRASLLDPLAGPVTPRAFTDGDQLREAGL